MSTSGFSRDRINEHFFVSIVHLVSRACIAAMSDCDSIKRTVHAVLKAKSRVEVSDEVVMLACACVSQVCGAVCARTQKLFESEKARKRRPTTTPRGRAAAAAPTPRTMVVPRDLCSAMAIELHVAGGRECLKDDRCAGLGSVAVRLANAGMIAVDALALRNKEIDAFKSKKGLTDEQKRELTSSHSKRAGLVLPSHHFKRLMLERIRYPNVIISSAAAIYMTGVAEAVVRVLGEACGNVVRKRGRKRVMPDALVFAINAVPLLVNMLQEVDFGKHWPRTADDDLKVQRAFAPRRRLRKTVDSSADSASEASDAPPRRRRSKKAVPTYSDSSAVDSSDASSAPSSAVSSSVDSDSDASAVDSDSDEDPGSDSEADLAATYVPLEGDDDDEEDEDEDTDDEDEDDRATDQRLPPATVRARAAATRAMARVAGAGGATARRGR
jgi:hypothetical protein